MTTPMTSDETGRETKLVPLRLKILVDGTKCDAHGICALRLPERISLDQWGYALVSDQKIVRRVTLRRARRAVAACPNGALELVETL